MDITEKENVASKQSKRTKKEMRINKERALKLSVSERAPLKTKGNLCDLNTWSKILSPVIPEPPI